MALPRIVHGVGARLACYCAAFGVGCIVCMIAIVLTDYEGGVAMLLAPFMAMLCSGVFTFAAVLLGLPLQLPVVRQFWRPMSLIAVTAIGGSLLLLCFGSWLGLTDAGINPATGESVTTLHPLIAISSYFTLIFAVANFPLPRLDAAPASD